MSLYNNKNFQKYIPKMFPFRLEEKDEAIIGQYIQNNKLGLCDITAEYLKENHVALYEKIKSEIGELPWIIRSSGDEDRPDNPNAGAYESYSCYQESDFYVNLAKTVLSGISVRALLQGAFVEENFEKKLIPVFFQRLIISDNRNKPENVPLISESHIEEMIEIIKKIHHFQGVLQLDLEWVLESNMGIVSGTSLSKLMDDNIVAEISLGFGLTSTQHCSSAGINNMFVDASGEIRYQKRIFRAVDVQKIWLVQARETHNFMLTKEVPLLKNEFVEGLKRRSDVVIEKYDEEIIIGNRFDVSKTIIAVTLMQAWNMYLHLSPSKRKEIAVVIVQIGIITEHAGIMFNQTGITVIRCEITQKIEQMKRANCFIDYKNHDAYFVKNIVKDEEWYQGKEIVFAKSNYFKMFMDTKKSYDYDEALMKDEKCYVWPDDECVVISENNVFAPCYIEVIEKNNCIKGENRNSYLKELIDLRRRFLDIDYLKKYPSIGLRRIILKLQSEIQSDQLIQRIFECFLLPDVTVEKVYNLLLQLRKFNQSIFSLDCFDSNETEKIYSSLTQLLTYNMKIEEKTEILRLTSVYGLSPFCLCDLFDNHIADLQLINSYKLFMSCLSELKSDNVNEIFDLNKKIIGEYEKIQHTSHHNLLKCAYYQAATEAYDSYAKNIAERLSVEYSKYHYDKYVQILQAFGHFVAHFSELNNVGAYIHDWLISNAYLIDRNHYHLKEYDLGSVLRNIQNGQNYSFDNIHQVHNFLHQWALLESPDVSPNELGKKLQSLFEFSNTFSAFRSRVLRFESQIIEINLPMCTHKASFQLTKDCFYVEFSEPPGTKDREIGRLVALDNIINRFFDGDYKLEHFYEKQLGSWSWYVYVKPIEKREYFKKFEYFIKVMKLLLDSSYDFSHTLIANVKYVQKKYVEEEWKDIFEKFLQYRENICSDIFSELKVFSLSDSFTQLSTNDNLRKYLLTLYHAGFDMCIKKYVTQAHILNAEIDVSEWIKEYRKIRITILFLVCVWPVETLNVLKDMDCDYDFKILIAKNLIIRKDIWTRILNTSFDGLCDLILHSAPQLLLTEENIGKYIELLTKRGYSYKLAKNYMLYNYVQYFSKEDLELFVKEQYYIPCPKDKKYMYAYKEIESEYFMFDIKESITTYL